MDSKQLEALLRDAVGDVDLRPEEIPPIDLYLDQIISLVDEKRLQSSPRFADRALTKTMVNNYSKDDLIRPIKGKKYTKDHILQMLLVYELKNTLSIGEIRRILQNVYLSPEYDEKTLPAVWARYLAIKEMERREVLRVFDSFVKETALDLSEEEDFLTMILGLSNFSSYLKNIVQVLLEEHYSAKPKKPKKPKKDKSEKAGKEESADADAASELPSSPSAEASAKEE